MDVDGISIANGHEHICIIEQKHNNDIGGKVQCWGFESYGMLDAPKDLDFIQITAGRSFTCGVTIDQTLHCWGQISGSIPGLFKQISADPSEAYFCGVMIDGTLYCYGHSSVPNSIPTGDQTIEKFVQISCGSYHCCALDENAFPHCWGSGAAVGELNVPLMTITKKDGVVTTDYPESQEVVDEEIEENETSEDAANPSMEEVPVTMKIQFRQLSVSNGHSCGITLEGSHLRCWGLDHYPKSKRAMYPKYSQGPYRQVSSGGMGVCVITSETVSMIRDDKNMTYPPDSVACWGNVINMVSQSSFESWDQISIGSSNVCGVSLDSELDCWGTTLPGEFKDHPKKFLIA
eukprot:gene14147-18985_t